MTRSKIYHFVLFMARGGMISTKKNLKKKTKKNSLHFFFTLNFSCCYCSIDPKKQSEQSVLHPDTSSLISNQIKVMVTKKFLGHCSLFTFCCNFCLKNSIITLGVFSTLSVFGNRLFEFKLLTMFYFWLFLEIYGSWKKVIWPYFGVIFARFQDFV